MGKNDIEMEVKSLRGVKEICRSSREEIARNKEHRLALE
jgi:hypothetical protein